MLCIWNVPALVPARLRHVLRRFRADEDVAGVFAQARMFGHKTEVTEIGRVETAKGDVL